tara:strand:+ start:2143 stop:3312 length:1170 start_codon:yes stop_codon:yes gene_type:complete
VKNLVNAILSVQAILVLAFGACTNGKLKDETAPGSSSDSTALSEDFNGHLRIKDAHQYYTFRGDIPKEAYIEIVIDKPELISAGSAFRIQYNPLPIYGGQNNALITIDSFSFSPATLSYLRPINQSPAGFYLIEHPDLGRYEALVTDSTSVQFRQGDNGRLKLDTRGPTSDYYDVILAIQEASVGKDLEDIEANLPFIAKAARDMLKSKSSNVYLEFFMALFNTMDGASSKNIQSIMSRMDNIDYQQALFVKRSAPYDIAMPDTAGRPISISDYSGKVVLIDFWASWCAPCRQENPNLVRLHKKYSKQGFDILSISLDNVRSRWVQAINDDNLYWEGHCSDLNGWNTKIVNMYNIQGIPTSFLIGRDGLMIWNSNDPQVGLEEAIKEAL